MSSDNTIITYMKKLHDENITSNNNESKCTFVSSRGIMRSCDVFDKEARSSIHYITPNYNFGLLKPGSLVYVCNAALQDFASFFDKLPHPFILISGDCDRTMPYETFSDATLFTKLVNSNLLIHWFCQNSVIKHNKITKMPIGMDYHTMKSSTIWGPLTSCEDQETFLMNVSRIAQPFYERKRLCYVNFMHTLNREYGAKHRVNALNEIPEHLLLKEMTHIDRNDSWVNMSRYAFVVSPHGGGLDCHRTWEAILLGCIPIVKKSSIDELYKELPVLIVNNWFEVNEDLLEKTIEKFKNMTFNFDKLKLDYWVKLFYSKKYA
jgi:hypothetical protein